MKVILGALLMLALVIPAGVHAQSAGAATRSEIAALLEALGTSQCEFFRNGTWYASAQAESHLKRKLDYFERKRLLTTVDAFIDTAASRSSVSGKAYQVRCADQPAQASADWLKRKLADLRQHAIDSAH